MAPPSRDHDSPRLTKGRVLRFLAGVSNTSAIVFSTFLTVHLASPILAVVGGGELASQVQLLGRAYYHPLEPYLIFGPLAIHTISSVARRLLLTSTTRSLPRPTLHLISGYLLIPLVIPHILTHRIIPLSNDAPISSLSPSELDYSFVGYALKRYPWTSWAAYLGISIAGVAHAVGGAVKIGQWLGYRSKRRDDLEAEARGESLSPRGSPSLWDQVIKGVISRQGVMLSTIALITIGLVRIRLDSADVSPATARRMEAVFKRVPGWHF